LLGLSRVSTSARNMRARTHTRSHERTNARTHERSDAHNKHTHTHTHTHTHNSQGNCDRKESKEAAPAPITAPIRTIIDVCCCLLRMCLTTGLCWMVSVEHSDAVKYSCTKFSCKQCRPHICSDRRPHLAVKRDRSLSVHFGPTTHASESPLESAGRLFS
jgi:hypothetical protein